MHTSSIGYRVDIGNLNHLIEDVASACQASEPEPNLLSQQQLIERLTAAKEHFPLPYWKYAIEPLIQFVEGHSDFCSEKDSAPCFIVRKYTEAFLQRAEGDITTRAFQEIVDDLFVSFLRAEDAKSLETSTKIKAPDLGFIPPIVRWDWDPKIGPFIKPNTLESSFLTLTFPWSAVPLVNLPIGYRKGGVAAWTTLGHETVGHGILSADVGLLDELKAAVVQQVSFQLLTPTSGDMKAVMSVFCLYWGFLISEAAADVMGALHLGPTAALGFIAYIRGKFKADGVAMGTMEYLKRMNVGLMGEPHPPVSWRMIMLAETVRLLKFSHAELWANRIEEEALKDFGDFALYARVDSRLPAKQILALPRSDLMIQIAKSVARTIATHKLFTLEGHALIEIQCWSDVDEAFKEQFMRYIEKAIPEHIEEGCFAPHVLSAATELAVRSTNEMKIQEIFSRMVTLLFMMHQTNPNWTRPLLHSDVINITVKKHVSLVEELFPDLGASSGPSKKKDLSFTLSNGLFCYEGSHYKRIYETEGDGACGIHSLLGKLTEPPIVRYVMEAPPGGAGDIQFYAKQRYVNAMRRIVRGEHRELQQDLRNCVQERLVETREYQHQVANFDNRIDGLKGMVLEILGSEEGRQFFEENEIVLRGIFESGGEHAKFETLRANVTKPEFSTTFFNHILALLDRFKNLPVDHSIWHDVLVYMSEIERVMAERDAALNQFVDNNFQLYEEKMLRSDAHLCLDELVLFAKLESPATRVIIFNTIEGLTKVVNEHIQDNIIAIEHAGRHYSRLDPIAQDVQIAAPSMVHQGVVGPSAQSVRTEIPGVVKSKTSYGESLKRAKVLSGRWHH